MRGCTSALGRALGEHKESLHHAMVVSTAWLPLAADAWSAGVIGGGGGEGREVHTVAASETDGGFGRPFRCSTFHAVLCARGTVWGEEEC